MFKNAFLPVLFLEMMVEINNEYTPNANVRKSFNTIWRWETPQVGFGILFYPWVSDSDIFMHHFKTNIDTFTDRTGCLILYGWKIFYNQSNDNNNCIEYQHW